MAGGGPEAAALVVQDRHMKIWMEVNQCLDNGASVTS